VFDDNVVNLLDRTLKCGGKHSGTGASVSVQMPEDGEAQRLRAEHVRGKPHGVRVSMLSIELRQAELGVRNRLHAEQLAV
jgi:hypothetical protein